MKKFRWLIILNVTLNAFILFKTYTNQIVSVVIYKPDDIKGNGLKHIVTIVRDEQI